MEENTEQVQTNLIVNYIPQDMTDDDFGKLFRRCGNVQSAQIIRNKTNNYSYGYGFVNYYSVEDAQKAVHMLNGHEIGIKRLRVAVARPRGEKSRQCTLYVSNLSPEMTDDELASYFVKYGELTSCRCLTNSQNQCTGIGFVIFATKDQAEAAIAGLNGFKDNHWVKPMNVKYSTYDQSEEKMNYYLNKAGKMPKRKFSYFEEPYGGNYYEEYYEDPRASMYPPRGGMGPMYPPMSKYSRNEYNHPLTRMPPPPPRAMMYGRPGEWGQVPNQNKGGGTTLFMYNIGPNTHEQDIWSFFKPSADILKVDVMRDTNTGLSKNYCFVKFKRRFDAERIMRDFNNQDPFNIGAKLEIKWYNN